MKQTSILPAAAALAVGILGTAATSQATLITNSANLPPAGVYLSTDIHAIYGGPALQFLLTLPEHAPIAAQVDRRSGGGTLGLGTPADEIETFGSTLTAMMDVTVNGNSITGGPQPISASGGFGSVQVLTQNKIGNVTGTFNTEMLQLNLSGNSPLGPFMIRESPTLQSTGQTSIQDIGGGQFQIDSFFDVFTELSIDGGASWMPSHDAANAPYSGHVTLEPIGGVPEPGTLAWGAAMGLCLGLRRARARRA